MILTKLKRIHRFDFSVTVSINIRSDIPFKDPTPIQRMAIPIGLQNRDIIGIAETGLFLLFFCALVNYIFQHTPI